MLLNKKTIKKYLEFAIKSTFELKANRLLNYISEDKKEELNLKLEKVFKKIKAGINLRLLNKI